MQIFLTNLSKYNNGFLIGEWLELPNTKDELKDALRRVLGRDEECFISDTEGIPFEVNKYESVYDLNDKLEQHEVLEEHERLCVAFLLSEGYDWDYSMEHHEDVILYADENLEDVAYNLVQDGCFGSIPESLSNYIDYESMGRDLGHEGYIQRPEGVFCYAA